MTSLRMRVVEAGARAFVAHMEALSVPDNLTLMDEDLEAGAAAFDAMLDCLTENADEWVLAAAPSDLDDAMERGDHKLADVLLAVLREDR